MPKETHFSSVSRTSKLKSAKCSVRGFFNVILKIKWKAPHKYGSPRGYKPKEQMCVINGVTEACERKNANVFNIIKRRWAYFTRMQTMAHTCWHTLNVDAYRYAVHSIAMIPVHSFSAWMWINIIFVDFGLQHNVYTCKCIKGGKRYTAKVGVILNTTFYTFKHIYEAFRQPQEEGREIGKNA